ncbi:hypothetical protein [Pseudoxanthomonas mexicana]
MSGVNDLASRMYPNMAQAAVPGGQPAAMPASPSRSDTANPVSPGPGSAQAESPAAPSAQPQQQAEVARVGPTPQAEQQPPLPSGDVEAEIDVLVSKELTLAERMYPGAPGHETVDAAHTALDSRFSSIVDNSEGEERENLVQGHQAAAELLHEWQVPRDAANEISAALSEANVAWAMGKLPDDETFERQRQQGVEALRQEWGSEFKARCALATQAYRQALVKAPWLANLVEEVGAGNNPKLVKHFAEIGLRNARRARRAKQ